MCNRSDPPSELRVRTAVDTATGRARESELFAYRGFRPEKHRWHCTITLNDHDGEVDDQQRQLLWAQLAAVLESGWMSFGKTKARGTAKVSTDPVPSKPSPVKIGQHECFVVSLQSPALMLDPRQSCKTLNPTIDEVDELYDAYWQDVSRQLFRHRRSHRFAGNELIGGYQAYRYRFQPDPKGHPPTSPKTQRELPYNPSLLTSAGSVFVLQFDSADSNKAEDKIREWLRYGLPLPSWAKQAYGETFATNPFLPQNGYGEIRVNHKIVPQSADA